MSTSSAACRYPFESAAPPHTAEYLTPSIVAHCRKIGARRLLDLGCGNGALCSALSLAGFDVVGCDSSEDGIAIARSAHPRIPFHLLSLYEEPGDLAVGGFDAVVSTEVIEHL